MKQHYFLWAVVCLLNYQLVFSQSKKPTPDFKVIKAVYHVSYPGTVPASQGIAVKGDKTTQPHFVSPQSYTSTSYHILLVPQKTNLRIDSVYYNGFVAESIYNTSLEKGQMYDFYLGGSMGKGNTPYPIKNVKEGTVLFRYRKAGKVYYYKVENFEKTQTFYP